MRNKDDSQSHEQVSDNQEFYNNCVQVVGILFWCIFELYRELVDESGDQSSGKAGLDEDRIKSLVRSIDF